MPINPSIDKFECRYCGCKQSKVVNTETSERHFAGRCITRVVRYRQCRHCGLRYKTVEFPAQDEPNNDIPKDSAMRPAYDYGRAVGQIEVINATGAPDRELPLPINPLTSPTEKPPPEKSPKKRRRK